MYILVKDVSLQDRETRIRLTAFFARDKLFRAQFLVAEALNTNGNWSATSGVTSLCSEKLWQFLTFSATWDLGTSTKLFFLRFKPWVSNRALLPAPVSGSFEACGVRRNQSVTGAIGTVELQTHTGEKRLETHNSSVVLLGEASSVLWSQQRL